VTRRSRPKEPADEERTAAAREHNAERGAAMKAALQARTSAFDWAEAEAFRRLKSRQSAGGKHKQPKAWRVELQQAHEAFVQLNHEPPGLKDLIPIAGEAWWARVTGDRRFRHSCEKLLGELNRPLKRKLKEGLPSDEDAWPKGTIC